LKGTTPGKFKKLLRLVKTRYTKQLKRSRLTLFAFWKEKRGSLNKQTGLMERGEGGRLPSPGEKEETGESPGVGREYSSGGGR